MLELLNRRISSGKDSTLGTLFNVSDGIEFLCYVLEDQFNEPKIPGETRIPPGRYQIKLRTAGGMHSRYTSRFPATHKGMLWLQNVPGFEWIYIHTGNNDDHSEGCLLVGDGQVQNVTTRGGVTSSVAAYKRVYEKISSAIESGESVFITVEDYG